MRHAAARTLAGLALITPIPGAGADIIRVNPGASGDGSGSTWADAATSVQDALDLADAGDEIWIRAGTYLPPAVDIGYEITQPVTIRGGFAGTESHPDQRPTDGPATIFSGDMLGNDGPDFTNREDNASRLFTVDAVSGVVTFDRITVRSIGSGLNAWPRDAISGQFTSMVITSCTFVENGPDSACVWISSAESGRIEDCVFADNRTNRDNVVNASQLDRLDVVGSTFARNSSAAGSALSVRDSMDINIEQCTFVDHIVNSSIGAKGAGLWIYGSGVRTVRITGSHFYNNNAGESGRGGAACIDVRSGDWNDFDPDIAISGCRFGGNSAELWGGALYIDNNHGSNLVENSVFMANASETTGGGIYCDGPLTVANCLIYRNQISGFMGSDLTAGAGVMVDRAPATVTNSILWGNSWEGIVASQIQVFSYQGVDVRASCVDSLSPYIYHMYDDATFDADPGFLNPAGPDGILGTADDDFTLSLASPCIDAGNADLLPPDWLDLDADGDTAEPLPVDARGRPRRVDVPGTPDALPGQSPAVDIGPVEYQLADCPADLAEPVGSLNAADALAFIDAFNAQDPAADLAAPFGTLNFFDIAAFIDRYNAGCP